MSDEEGEVQDPREQLLKTQRKEKKDLQGKIQALKKTASKGDKKKKKEVNDEIAKLEADLQLKHKTELLELDTQKCNLNNGDTSTATATTAETAKDNDHEDCDNDGDEGRGMRVSKAQKRRDKKAEKEKQRLLDIEAQEAENLTGQRNLEQEAITRLLEARGLALHQVPSDGDCMFAGQLFCMRP